MDAETWGEFQTLADPPYIFGESFSLRVEVLCTGDSVLGRSAENRHLGSVNALARSLNLPSAVVHSLHVERVAGERDQVAIIESDVGVQAFEVPVGARPRDTLTVEDDKSRRQIRVPDTAQPGSVFVAPRLIDGARVDVDVAAVTVPIGFEGGDVLTVNAVGGQVDAVVPHGAKEGQTFMQEYHPRRTSSPEFRVTFEIDQPRYNIDGWQMGTGSARYPLDIMENEMKHRLNTRGCGLVTHISIERVDAIGGWKDTDGATTRLWNAAEAGDVRSVRQILAELDMAGLLQRGSAGSAGPVNMQGPVSGATALHLAARWGHAEVIMELLLRGGADASVVDANGRTAEEVAAECRQIRATKVLEDWRQRRSDRSLPNRSHTDSRAGWRHDQSEEQATDKGDMLFNGWDSGRLSSEDLDRERGQELRDWKEQRVDEAVALIRAMQREAPPQALQFETPSAEESVPGLDDFVLYPTPIREPWPDLDRVGMI